MGFIHSQYAIMEGVTLEHNESQETTDKLKVIGIILEHKEPKNNPFSAMPQAQVAKALKFLEEMSEEFRAP